MTATIKIIANMNGPISCFLTGGGDSISVSSEVPDLVPPEVPWDVPDSVPYSSRLNMSVYPRNRAASKTTTCVRVCVFMYKLYQHKKTYLFFGISDTHLWFSKPGTSWWGPRTQSNNLRSLRWKSAFRLCLGWRQVGMPGIGEGFLFREK